MEIFKNRTAAGIANTTIIGASQKLNGDLLYHPPVSFPSDVSNGNRVSRKGTFVSMFALQY